MPLCVRLLSVDSFLFADENFTEPIIIHEKTDIYLTYSTSASIIPWMIINFLLMNIYEFRLKLSSIGE